MNRKLVLATLNDIKQKCGKTVLKMIWNKSGQHVDFIVNDACNIIENELKALDIILNINKASHIKLGERRIGQNKTSYYLIISCGPSECEYKLKDKNAYDILKAVLYEKAKIF